MRYLIISIVALSLYACVSKSEYEQKVAELDSLKNVLTATQSQEAELTQRLLKVSEIIDGIETSQKNLRISLEKGISFEDFQKKAEAIKADMEKSKKQIEALEKALNKSSSKNKLLEKMVEEMKKQLAEKDAIISDLTAKVEKLKGENTALNQIIEFQKEEIKEKEAELSKKKAEISELESKLSETQKQALKEAADLFYLRGEDNIALAEKTKLAPNKKRAHYQDAYNMFKRSFELGRADAFKRMQELEEKIK
ncbi:MAG: hypothetical protein NZM38_09145 [Cytophagales bacterium]|nr:hypothetical protein [Cytophagales bacterium]MDW8384924.1 hypothetical protein [Flammeovirgaceae bacterium]